MHRILAHYSRGDFYIVSRTGLANQCLQSFPYILSEYLIAILRDPHQMNLQIVNGMSCVLLWIHNQNTKALGLKVYSFY